jgi:hypothetical protein
MAIHTKQARSLRQDTRFWDLQKDIYTRAEIGPNANHPLLQNAKYKYLNVLLYVCSRPYNGTRVNDDADGEDLSTEIEPNLTADTYGAVLLGPRAVACANGGFPTRMEGGGESVPGVDGDGNIATKYVYSDNTDYENEVKIGVDMIWADVRADITKEAGGTVNESSAIFWTHEG